MSLPQTIDGLHASRILNPVLVKSAKQHCQIDYAYKSIAMLEYLVKLKKLCTLAALCTVTMFNVAIAQEEGEQTGPRYVYIALDPDIITNYAGDNAKKLGYLRMTVELMLDNPIFITDVEHHMPLLRASAIEVIGAQNEQKIRSLTGREEIRRTMLKNFRDILMKETGNEVVKDIIFTKYLRQGG
jgi:flagellar FliL protein